jgi:NAD(P)-dependent dehydrogenase (short-subunit alcohol dehydrogenase family)
VNVLASDGGAVVVADVDDAGGARVVAELEAAGGKAAFIHTDVSQERQAEAMVELAVDTFGRLDGAINNAGIGHAVKRLHEVSTAECDRLHSIDLRGVFFCMQAEINHFLAAGSSSTPRRRPG